MGAAALFSTAAGAYQQDRAARKAAKTQAQAAADANALEREMYQQSRADMEPWRKQGAESLNQLAQLMQPGGQLTERFGQQDFQTDPGYQFRLSQGQNALTRALGARGMRNSGAAVTEAMRQNQGMAADEYQNAYNRWAAQNSDLYNRLAGLSGTGQATSNQLANLSSNYAGQVGQNLGQAANARASGYVARSQIGQNALADIMKIIAGGGR